MKIDSHVHISVYENNAKNLEEAFELLLSDMRENQIDYAMVIPDNVENSPKIADLYKAIELTKDHDNIFLLGSPQIIQRGSSEIEKYQDLLKKGSIKGIKFYLGHESYFPTDERCLPYYELCQELDAPVLFHTGENSNDSKTAKWNDPKYIVEVAKQYPKLKVIITHYYWPKLEYCYEITKNSPNIYFETAGLADREVIEKSGGIEKVREILTKTINDRPDQALFGSDWPMGKIEDHVKLIESLGISQALKEKVFSKNAIKTYKLPFK
jgi:uncharacterized protein